MIRLSTMARRALARRGRLVTVTALVLLLAGGWLAHRPPAATTPASRNAPAAPGVASQPSTVPPTLGDTERDTRSALAPAPASVSSAATRNVSAATDHASGPDVVVSARQVHDRSGARGTALTYVVAIGERVLYAGDGEGRRLLRYWSAPDVADASIDETVTAYASARARLAAGGGRVWWLVAPLAVRVVSVTDARAEVAVWAVRVLSSEPRTGDGVVPLATWTTTSVELVWVDGVGWSVSNVHTTAGPVPLYDTTAQPATAAGFSVALAGFELAQPDAAGS